MFVFIISLHQVHMRSHFTNNFYLNPTPDTQFGWLAKWRFEPVKFYILRFQLSRIDPNLHKYPTAHRIKNPCYSTRNFWLSHVNGIQSRLPMTTYICLHRTSQCGVCSEKPIYSKTIYLCSLLNAFIMTKTNQRLKSLHTSFPFLI